MMPPVGYKWHDIRQTPCPNAITMHYNLTNNLEPIPDNPLLRPNSSSDILNNPLHNFRSSSHNNFRGINHIRTSRRRQRRPGIVVERPMPYLRDVLGKVQRACYQGEAECQEEEGVCTMYISGCTRRELGLFGSAQGSWQRRCERTGEVRKTYSR